MHNHDALDRIQPDMIQKRFADITHLYFKHMYQSIEKLGVHPGQIPLMMCLLDNSKLSQKELADHMCIRPPTLTVMIQRMEKTGLIERGQNESDMRVSQIGLTAKGRDVAVQIMVSIRETEQLILDGLDLEEVETLKRILAKLKDNLSNIPDKDD